MLVLENSNVTASSSQSPVAREAGQDFSTQLNHMHEMGLLDDALNIRALLICSGMRQRHLKVPTDDRT